MSQPSYCPNCHKEYDPNGTGLIDAKILDGRVVGGYCPSCNPFPKSTNETQNVGVTIIDKDGNESQVT